MNAGAYSVGFAPHATMNIEIEERIHGITRIRRVIVHNFGRKYPWKLASIR